MNPYNVTGPTAAEVAQVESIVSQRLKGSFLWIQIGYALRTKILILSY